MEKIRASEKDEAVEKLIRKSLSGAPIRADAKYKICSKCGATIPMDTRVCSCGAEYPAPGMSVPMQDDSAPATGDILGEIAIDDSVVDTEFNALKESFSSAESELEKIAEEIAMQVKGDLKRKEAALKTSADTIQDTILRLQQEIIEMKNQFDKIAENVATEVREEIKKHEDSRISAIENRIKETLDKLHTDMKKEGASLKEEDSKIRGAKKELYEEVNKLMDHLKKNEKEIIEREKALIQRESELERKKNELERQMKEKEAEIERLKRTASGGDEWKREEMRLRTELERMKIADSQWKDAEARMKSELERLKQEELRWKNEEARLKAAISAMDVGGTGDGSKYAEIAKMQSKILVALLKDNPTGVLKVIKALGITKEELKKLMS